MCLFKKSLYLFFVFGLCTSPLVILGNIYTPNPATPIHGDMRLSQEGPLELRLVAPRNGFATAPIVVRGESREITARLSSLSAERGNASLGRESIDIHYGIDAFHPNPRRDDDWQVIWVSVQVPADAMPGVYRGEVQGLRQSVPIKLEVGEWLAPRPSDHRILSGFIQSPETVALHYGVTMWSDDHFEYLEKHLELMGQLGNDTLFLPMVARTHLTHDYPLLRFTTSGGSFRPELSVVERYLELWNRHVGPPRYVIMYMLRNPGDFTDTVHVSHVSSSNSSGGSVREAPNFGERGSVEMWRPAVEGIQRRMNQLGWDRSEAVFGVIHDGRDFTPGFRDFFSAIGPEVAWSTFTHARGDPNIPWDETHVIDGIRFSHMEWPYDPSVGNNIFDGEANWNRKVGYATTHRHHFQRMDTGDVGIYRHFASRPTVTSGQDRAYGGFGRIGFDYWSVDLGRRERPIIGMHDRNNNLYRNNPRSIVEPSEDGPLKTHAFVMAREGLAEAEAYAVLYDAVQKGKVRGSLKSEAEEVGERFRAIVGRLADNRETALLHTTEWQDVLVDLLDVAARVAEESGQVAELPDIGSGPALFREDRARDWSSEDGRTITAQFLEYDGRQVTMLLEGNREVAVPLDRLSQEDQDWVREETGYRIWRNAEGREIEARMVAGTSDDVTIVMPDGREFQIPLNALSQADQDFVRSEVN